MQLQLFPECPMVTTPVEDEDEKTEFRFEELSDDAKEYAVRTYGDADYRWWDFLYERWTADLEAVGFENPQIEFSGFWSQGDGASFTCSSIDNEKLITALMYNGESYETISKLLPIIMMNDTWADELGIVGDYETRLSIYSLSSRYSHKYTKAMTGEYHEYFENEAEFFRETAEDYRKELCDAIYDSLEEEYEYLTSEEAFAERADCNEWLFDEEGRML